MQQENSLLSPGTVLGYLPGTQIGFLLSSSLSWTGHHSAVAAMTLKFCMLSDDLVKIVSL